MFLLPVERIRFSPRSSSSRTHDRVLVNLSGSACKPNSLAMSQFLTPPLCWSKCARMDSLRSSSPFAAFSCGVIILHAPSGVMGRAYSWPRCLATGFCGGRLDDLRECGLTRPAACGDTLFPAACATKERKRAAKSGRPSRPCARRSYYRDGVHKHIRNAGGIMVRVWSVRSGTVRQALIE